MKRGYPRSKTPAGERDEWRTPPYLYEYADRRWGPFHVDLAAAADNALAPYHLNAKQDALSVDWHKLTMIDPLSPPPYPMTRGWLNPPYSHPRAWIEKAVAEAREGFTTVMLLPSFNGNSPDATVLEHAIEIVFIIGRVSFLRPHADEKAAGNFFGSIFARFAPVPYYAERRTGPAISWLRRAIIEAEWETRQKELNA